MDSKKISIIVGLGIAVLIGLFLLTPEARSIAYSAPYQDPVYRTDSSQDPVYRTDSYQDPIYRTDYYQDPVYATLYSGTIGNYGLTGQTWTITDATSYSSTYTGSGFWGSEYTLNVCWSSTCINYYQIQFNNLKSETKITSYVAKTRQVIDHYETKYTQVIDHYETKYTKVIDHYETKYRTDYKDVKKTKLEWIFS